MATGTATIDFGATPAQRATVLVSGLSGISAGSQKEPWFQDDDTTVGTGGITNDEGAHEFMRMFARAGAAFVSSTSMNINVYLSKGRATGKFIVHWAN
jgi:hypothetical protein